MLLSSTVVRRNQAWRWAAGAAVAANLAACFVIFLPADVEVHADADVEEDCEERVPLPWTTDFDSDWPLPDTAAETEGEAEVDAVNGRLVVTVFGQEQQAVGAYYSTSPRPLQSRRLAAEVSTVLGGNSFTFLGFQRTHTDKLSVMVLGGNLGVNRAVGERVEFTPFFPYEPEPHRWWRLRAKADEIEVEVSPDGQAWSRVGAVERPAWDQADFLLGAGTLDPPTPGEAHFERLEDTLCAPD